MKVILVILSVAIASSSGSKLPFAQEKDLANIQSRIINGYTAKEGQVPYIVNMIFNNGIEEYICGGSIIGNSWILTAAHCIDQMVSVKIFYGTTKFKQGQMVEVYSHNFIQHPQYTGAPYYNDIALIHTPHVQFSKLINKIKLADRDTYYEDSRNIACGWGLIIAYGASSEDLQCVSLNAISNAVCKQSWGGGISDRQLCVNTSDWKSTCQGDSGGSLVTPDGTKLIGVTSFGVEDCGSSSPAVFARVSAYLDWIRETTGIESY